jgi:hypothetical protein
MNFRSKAGKLNQIHVADTVTLEHNYSLIQSTNGRIPLIKVGEHQVKIKLHIWPMSRSGPEMVQTDAHLAQVVARQVFDILSTRPPCREAAHPCPCHAPLPSPRVVLDTEA